MDPAPVSEARGRLHGSMAGAIGLMVKVVAYFPPWTGSYRIPFLIAGFAYLVALGRYP